MGGSVGNTIGRIGSGVLTLGGSEIARNNLPRTSPVRQLFQAPGTVLTGGMNGKDSMPSLFGGQGGAPNPYVSGPFTLDPNQYNQDQSDILGLGGKQYSDTLAALGENRTASTQRAKDLFSQMLPNIAENSQAAHLYDSTGYGQEVARQQSSIASELAKNEADQRLQALGGRQGFETGALQRGQSLEDFINQANVAKTIGAQMAPQPPTGKQNFGTVAQGVGALAPFAKLGKAAAPAAAAIV